MGSLDSQGRDINLGDEINQNDSKFWVKSPYPDIEPPLGIEFQDLMMDKMAAYGDMPALTCAIAGERVTYRQMLEQAKSLGAALLQAGYQKGEIAALCLGNVLEFPVILLGCWTAGLTVVCLNPRYTDHETLRQFEMVEVGLVFAEEETRQVVLEAQRKHPEIRNVAFIRDQTLSEGGSTLLYSEMIKTATKGVKFPRNTGDTQEMVATLVFSSGTTGPPKVAMLTHAFLATSLTQFVQEDIGPTKGYHETGEQERTIALMPFFHVYGFWIVLLLGLYQGCHIMCLPRFQPESFLQAIRTHRPTVLYLVTPLISHIVNSADFTGKELDSVRIVMGGGCPIGNVLINKLIEKADRFVAFTEIYGMSETLQTHVLNPSTQNRKIGSCGRCTPSNMSRVIDIITGENLGPFKNGEILSKFPVKVKGYYRNEEATKTLVDSEGWVHSGDIGYYDEEGYFYVVDRIKELIKVKAFQVAPSELEDLLRKHPKVVDCAVIGVPSPTHGEVPRAYVVAKEGEVIREEEIHDYINPMVATFKQFKGGVEVVAEIDKSPSGKILRRELKERYSRMINGSTG